MGIIQQFAQRKVPGVLAGYAVVCFVLLQIADATFDAIGIPDWVLRGAIAFMVIGFPIAAYVAWTFELTADHELRRTPAKNPRMAFGLTMFVVFGLMVGSWYWIAPSQKTTADPSAADATTEHENLYSLAILPFENLGGEAALNGLASGLTQDVVDYVANAKII